MTRPTPWAVAGLGYIGSSWVLAVRAAQPQRPVIGWDANPEVARQARDLGLVDEARSDPPAAVADAELLLLAVPVPAMADAAAAVAPRLAAGATVTDVGSVMGPVADTLRPVWGGRFVPGHPLAGSEQSGPAAARGDLFRGAAWALDGTGVDQEAWSRTQAMVRSVGAVPVACPAAVHDQTVAVTSHLPYLVAVALCLVADPVTAAGPPLFASGLGDGTRVAASDPKLWAGILRANAAAVLAAVDAYQRQLADLRAALVDSPDQLAGRLAQAAVARRRLGPAGARR